MQARNTQNRPRRVRIARCSAVLAGVLLAWMVTGCQSSPVHTSTSRTSRAVVDGHPTQSAPAQKLDWVVYDQLAQLELSFYDLEANEILHVTGPYQLVYWDEHRLDLVGQLNDRWNQARLTLWSVDDQVWAQLSLLTDGDRQYLTRME